MTYLQEESNVINLILFLDSITDPLSPFLLFSFFVLKLITLLLTYPVVAKSRAAESSLLLITFRLSQELRGELCTKYTLNLTFRCVQMLLSSDSKQSGAA